MEYGFTAEKPSAFFNYLTSPKGKDDMLKSLVRWDRPHKLMTRPSPKLKCRYLSDIMVYRCPVWKTWRLAIISMDGVYWTLPHWYAGGTFAVKTQRGAIRSVVLGLDPSSMFNEALQLINDNWDYNVVEFQDKMHGIYVDALEYDPDTHSSFFVTRINRACMFAEVSFYDGPLDKPEFTAFELSVRSARFRHMKKKHRKDWEERVEIDRLKEKHRVGEYA